VKDSRRRRDRRFGRVLILCVSVAGAVAALQPAAVAHAALAPAVSAGKDTLTPVARTDDDTLKGRSGKLRAILVPRSSRHVGILERLFGDSALRTPGVHSVSDTAGTMSVALITMRDFGEKLGGRIGDYRIGFWPAERGRRTPSAAYANPEGFIEVTPENADTRISEHFRLSDFLTHDQDAVWPKYLVLRSALVDKLELVIAQLESRGIHVTHMQVMSGFRTPLYNARAGERGGRSKISRHMYGDAADVFVDNDGDGRMDDLNHDGRIDSRDARVILDAVEQVERQHEDLVGGVGVYRATHAHGPFAHVDVRGNRARWGRR
jgi:hypothetical protein